MFCTLLPAWDAGLLVLCNFLKCMLSLLSTICHAPDCNDIRFTFINFRKFTIPLVSVAVGWKFSNVHEST